MAELPESGDRRQQESDRWAQEHSRRWSPEMARFKPEELEGRLQEGMNVQDRDGGDVGSVAHVYSPTFMDDTAGNVYEVYVQVDRGLLAGDIYVPSRFIGEVEGDTVRLSVDKDEMADMTWDRPEFLPSW